MSSSRRIEGTSRGDTPAPRPFIAFAVLIVVLGGLLLIPLVLSLVRRLTAWNRRRRAGRPTSPRRPSVRRVPGPRRAPDGAGPGRGAQRTAGAEPGSGADYRRVG
ncbi:hypothetical protein [Streptomyces sp. NPDC090022]|uniref:hypothetical protein n=1 Tax=Streptomyces sp. NPDC090022 TaxID=3365920 RepID=UPI0037FA9230